MRICNPVVIVFVAGLLARPVMAQTEWPTKQWPSSTPAAVGLDANALTDLDSEIASGKYGYIDTMLVIRHGKVVYDRSYTHDYDRIYGKEAATPGPLNPHDPSGSYNYFNPWWHPFYRRGDLHTMQSVTKTVTGVVIGIATTQKMFPSLDSPVLKFFDTAKVSNIDDRKRRLTIRHLLTMTAGMEWNEDRPYSDPTNSCMVMEASFDWVQYAIDRPMAAEPGTVFRYNSGATQLLSHIFRVATGKDIEEYARAVPLRSARHRTPLLEAHSVRPGGYGGRFVSAGTRSGEDRLSFPQERGLGRQAHRVTGLGAGVCYPERHRLSRRCEIWLQMVAVSIRQGRLPAGMGGFGFWRTATDRLAGPRSGHGVHRMEHPSEQSEPHGESRNRPCPSGRDRSTHRCQRMKNNVVLDPISFRGSRMNRLLSLVRTTAFLALALVHTSPATAQEDPHAACAMPSSYVPTELLERTIPLRRGIGNSQESVTTSSAEAQAFYDQGLNYLESYVWIEAARSFHQALRLDAGLAMAYVGLSRVYSGLDNAAAAKRFFEKAKDLAPGVSAWERRRIEIRGKQLAAMDDIEDAARFLAYKKAIDEALTEDLENPQLWLLRGNAEEANASGRGQRGTAGSVAFYDAVLRLVPDHASAHHYLVHSYETIGRIDKALEHGEVYARLAPSIPHAAHMWAHDLRRVGRMDEAIAQFLKTDALERAYYAAEKIDPGLDWHHGHNLDLLATCYEHKGQMKLAEKVMRESAALPIVDAYRAFNLRELPNFLIHRARYKEALEAGQALAATTYPQSRAVGQALVGQALLGLGRVDAARDALEAARRELGTVPELTLGIVPRRSIVEPWVEALRGELLLRAGQREEGGAVLKAVVRALRATPGPDAWTQTLFRLESMARSARDAGDWDLAEFIARQMLDHDAAYGGSHLALALVLCHKGDDAGVTREIEAASRSWRDADSDLPELKQMTTGSLCEAIRSSGESARRIRRW